jgi:hypothetical protein
MKKLKIFLLLSILLCFGFVLSSEVYAQGGGPKIFEEGDVLPAGNIKISWDFSEKDNDFYATFYIGGSPSFHFNIDVYEDNMYRLYIPGGPTTEELVGNAIITLESDITITVTRDDGDISFFETIGDALWWEVAPPAPSGPKIFEEDDELPATTQLRISWTDDITDLRFKKIRTNNGNLELIYTDASNSVYINTNMDTDVINYETWEKIYNGNTSEFVAPYTNYDGSHAYIDIDISTWPISYRTVHSMDSVMDIFTWQDLNSSSDDYPKVLKEGDTLPAGYIKISWDFTDKPLAYGDIFSITGDYLDIEINQFDLPYNGYYIEVDINGEMFFGDTPGYTIIPLTESSTIYSVSGDDYYEYIHGTILWEVVTEEEFIYYEAYREGYLDGYFTGYQHARKKYGYYDTITRRWLSVKEYLELYGTDKLNQSDFYNNFDKYFIPAMIIVFGGAIVLTILKVFKGRE